MGVKKGEVNEIITLEKNSQAPILLNFQNGNLKIEAVDNLHYTTVLNKKTHEKELVTAVNGSTFHGSINDNSASSNSCNVNTFIAVRNKITKKVRLIQVRQTSLINTILDEKDKELDNSIISEDATKALLIKNFGGRRANRNYERAERMKMSIDVVKDQLDKSIIGTEITEDNDNAKINEESLAAIRPPFNKSAKKLDDIFSLYDVIPKDLMDRLNQEAETILATRIEDLPISSEYIKEKIKNIKKSSDPKSKPNMNAVKIYIYMDGLSNLMKLKERKLSKALISNITEKVENDIRVKFSQPELSSQLNTSYTKDKAICYYLVLALLTSPNYEINIDTLTQEMCISSQKLLKFAHYVNAKPKLKTGTLCLKLPEQVKALRPILGKRKRF